MHRLDKYILDLLENNGEMHTNEIIATMPEEERNIKSRLGILKKDGEVVTPQHRSRYRLSESTATSAQKRLTETRKKFSSEVRSAENNEDTINRLMNTYDEVLVLFQSWVLKDIVSKEIDFEQQLLFLENFKWLTMIADKLMKRWSLVHVGYDTNTRQAQEDAKAKTEERQKEALKDAPLEDTIQIVGMYDPDAKKLIESIPSSLKNMTDEEKEKTTV